MERITFEVEDTTVRIERVAAGCVRAYVCYPETARTYLGDPYDVARQIVAPMWTIDGSEHDFIKELCREMGRA